jgi:serine protease Do
LLQVETWDRSTYRARLVATEPGIDCALIRLEDIPREAYEPCVMGNSDNVKPGEMALAIGAPGSAEASNTERDDPSATFGLHQSTTIRVVAGRQTNAYQLVEWWSGWTGGQGYQVLTNTPWRFVTQTAISGGNSGGPLFNAKGEIIGLNHAHFGAGPVITQNENYAIPINFCRNFAYQIIEKGVYELPWFGLDMLVPKNVKSRTDISQFIERHADPEVLRVYSVRKDSPAEAAGIVPQDIIIEFDGRTFKDVTEFRQYVFTLDIGDVIPVVIERGREEIELNLVVGVKRHYNSEFSL